MSVDTGGPAFPIVEADPIGMSAPYTHTGMTLRDYFAAKAMQAEVSRGGLEGSDVVGCAIMAYEQADAMLAEREKK